MCLVQREITVLTQLLHTHAPGVLSLLAAPTPAPAAPTGDLDTQAILGFFVSKIAPILITIGACAILARAGKGEVSKVLTTTGILIIGAIVLVGAGTLVIFGRQIVNLMFT